MDAWERGDVDAVVAMLTEDATLRDAAASDLVRRPRARSRSSWPAGRCRATGAGVHVLVRANGQPALAFYSWDEDERAYLPFALNVLTFRGPADQRRHRLHRRGPRRIPIAASWRALPEQPADPRTIRRPLRALRSARAAGLIRRRRPGSTGPATGSRDRRPMSFGTAGRSALEIDEGGGERA